MAVPTCGATANPVEDVASGRVELQAIGREPLPVPLQTMAPAAARVVIEGKAEQRQKRQAAIRELAQRRSEFPKHEAEQQGGAAASLDDRIYGAVYEQATAERFR